MGEDYNDEGSRVRVWVRVRVYQIRVMTRVGVRVTISVGVRVG